MRGLKSGLRLDTNQYDTGIEVSREDIDQLHLKRHKWHCIPSGTSRSCPAPEFDLRAAKSLVLSVDLRDLLKPLPF
jgi:hypothetical protein